MQPQGQQELVDVGGKDLLIGGVVVGVGEEIAGAVLGLAGGASGGAGGLGEALGLDAAVAAGAVGALKAPPVLGLEEVPFAALGLVEPGRAERREGEAQAPLFGAVGEVVGVEQSRLAVGGGGDAVVEGAARDEAHVDEAVRERSGVARGRRPKAVRSLAAVDHLEVADADPRGGQPGAGLEVEAIADGRNAVVEQVELDGLVAEGGGDVAVDPVVAQAGAGVVAEEAIAVLRVGGIEGQGGEGQFQRGVWCTRAGVPVGAGEVPGEIAGAAAAAARQGRKARLQRLRVDDLQAAGHAGGTPLAGW